MKPTYDQLVKQNDLLQKRVQELETLNAKLLARLEELEEKLKINSKNSSISPSQDPFRKKSPPKPSGKKQGGQPGHKGHYRALLPEDQITTHREVFPSVCPYCSASSFDKQPVHTELRQVYDLPELQPDVTQYALHACKCSRCGKKVRASIPKEAEKAFGPRIMGFLSLLSSEGSLTLRKSQEVMRCLKIPISLGAISDIQQYTTRLLQDPAQEVLQTVLQANNLNIDETGWYLKHRRRWIWAGACSKATFFSIQASRSREAFESVFGAFQNTMTTDRHGAYSKYLGERQLCLAHLLRDFKKISERSFADGTIGRILHGELQQIFRYWSQFKAQQISREELQEKSVETVENIRVGLLIGAAAEQIGEKTQRFCKRLLKKFSLLWTFLYEEGVEPTNNLVERALRPLVIARKVSYGSQSEWGMEFKSRLYSVVATLKQQSKNIFEYLVNLFRSGLAQGPAPPIFT